MKRKILFWSSGTQSLCATSPLPTKANPESHVPHESELWIPQHALRKKSIDDWCDDSAGSIIDCAQDLVAALDDGDEEAEIH